jgi:hypothetical protein
MQLCSLVTAILSETSLVSLCDKRPKTTLELRWPTHASSPWAQAIDADFRVMNLKRIYVNAIDHPAPPCR